MHEQFSVILLNNPLLIRLIQSPPTETQFQPIAVYLIDFQAHQRLRW